MYSETQTHPARTITDATPETDLVLDVRLRLRLSAQDVDGLDLPERGDVHIDGTGHDLAAALLSGALHHLTEPSPPTGVFRREGEYWRIAHGGGSCLLKDMKGLRHLARLLAYPDREFHALDLVHLERGISRGGPNPGEDRQAYVPGFGDAGELLDGRAKHAYRKRLAALRDELDTADDPELRARLHAEQDALASELASAMGLGGRDVKAASAAERARLNVTNRIKAAIAKIAAHHPPLGRHLDRAVRTGVFCSYRPEPTAPLIWHT